MDWDVRLVEEVSHWYLALAETDPESADLVEAAINTLAREGPKLGRPLVDTLQGSVFPNLKELRPASSGRSEIRILFAFDPAQRAVLLVAGDKSGQWAKWYKQHIPLAERRYRRWLDGEYAEDIDR